SGTDRRRLAATLVSVNSFYGSPENANAIGADVEAFQHALPSLLAARPIVSLAPKTPSDRTVGKASDVSPELPAKPFPQLLLSDSATHNKPRSKRCPECNLPNRLEAQTCSC